MFFPLINGFFAVLKSFENIPSILEMLGNLRVIRKSLTADHYFWCSGGVPCCFEGVSGYYGMFQGCYGVFPGCSGVFRGCSGDVPGCSGGVPGCSGVFRVLQTPALKWPY